MNTPYLNCDKAREIPILKALERLGFSPRRLTAKEAWFLSPLRTETKASFKVSLSLNRWFDHGQGIGGNVIDLIQTIKNCTVSEALYFLSDIDLSFSFQKQTKILPQPKINYEIKRIKPIENQALFAYLDSRSINTNLAKKYCKEIYYSIDQKHYFGIAFKNRSGGYEIRNKYFKGGLGKKDVTLFENSKNTIAIFEGFFDFLSYATLNNDIENHTDFLILNSTSLIQKCNEILPKYGCVEIWLDNDENGKKTTRIIQEMHHKIIDKSLLLKECNDLNEYLIMSQSKGVKSQMK